MLFGPSILQLTPIWEREKTVVLAPSLVAARLRREESCEGLPVPEALRQFDRQFDRLDRRSSLGIRQFVSEARLAGVSLRDLDDWEVSAIVRAAIKTGDLVALRKGDKTARAPDGTAEQRRLVREIEKLPRGRMTLAGRRYKLVADVDLASVPGRNGYAVVDQKEAQRVLDGLAKESGSPGSLVGLFEQAKAKLTADWRPPFSQPDGLILLRSLPTIAASAVDQGPALTPSQLHKLAEPKPSVSIKIHLTDADTNEALDGVSLSLKLPNATDVSSHDTDEDGLVHVTDLRSGTFSLEGIDDEGAWELVDHKIE